MLEKALRNEVGIEVKLGDFGFATQLGEDEMI